MFRTSDVLKKVGGFIAGADHGKSEVERVEKHLQRIADGILPEDRQDAVAELRDLLMHNSEAQLALGNGGFPVLMHALREERGDVELVRGVLECLVIALQPSERSHQGALDPAAINAELLAKSEDTVPLLLSFLDKGEQSDFYVRYHTIQLLTALAAGGPYRLQGAILAAPMGVVRLMDLLGDAHEVIRNEAVLLLTGLTRASADIQKIAAFEGAFDRILQILGEEGWAQGGIIVQDCLEFLNNLLFNNAPNQLMFREVGHMAKAMPMLQPPKEESRWGLPRQTASNLLSALGTVLVLISPLHTNGQKQEKEETWVANASALMQHGLLDRLLSLAVAHGGVASSPVRTQALLCLERLIAGQPKRQEGLMKAKAADPDGTDMPALHCILQAALRSQEAGEAVAAEHVIRAFCRGNPDGQSSLGASLQQLDDPGSTGSTLMTALQSAKPLPVAYAAAVLRHILHSNASCKQKLLSITPEQGKEGDFPIVLLCIQNVLARAAASRLQDDPGRVLAVCMLLRLLITWLEDCTAAVAAFTRLQGLCTAVLELMRHSYGKASSSVNGLAAAVLGACLVPTSPASQPVAEAIAACMDIGSYLKLLESLQQDKFFLAASSTPSASSRPPPPRSGGDGEPSKPPALNPFDADFVQWLPPFLDRLRTVMQSGPPQLGQAAGHVRAEGHLNTSTAGLDPGQAQLAALAREMEEFREANRQLMAAAGEGPAANGSIASHTGLDAPAEHALSATKAAAEAAHKRAQIAEADAALHREKVKRLTEQLQASQQECAQLQTAGEEGWLNAAKLEADLEGLSGAYNALEAHCSALEARLRDLEASSGSGAPGQKAPAEEGAEEDDGLSDLLMCLGQEEQKVERLRGKLEELGVDVDSLLEGIGDPEDDAEASGDADLT